MRKHDHAETVGREHDWIDRLPAYLKRRGLSEHAIRFLARSAFFAYPATLWLRMAVAGGDADAANALTYRHGLVPEETGKAVNAWLRLHCEVRRVVFDLRGVTIFDLDSFLALYRAIGLEKTEKFCVCHGEIESLVRTAGEIGSGRVYSSERDLLLRLRDVPSDRCCKVRLPRELDLLSFDDALKQQAPPSRLKHYDAIEFDFGDVNSIDFQAHSMLSPVVHSMAHKHGILATVVKVTRRKLEQDLVNHGSFRVMRSNFIHMPQEYFRRVDLVDEPTGAVLGADEKRRTDEVGRSLLSMTAFGADDSIPIKRLCERRMKAILEYYKWWYGDVSGVSEGITATQMSREPERYTDLVRVMDELIDNAAHWSHGLGYVMIELDAKPGRGLSVYIGDTGIGLAEGIRKQYRMRVESDLKAVGMALRLAEFLPQRRRLKGTASFGGRGLEHVRHLLKHFSATLWVRSGSAMAEFSPKKKEGAVKLHEKLYDVLGTHYHLNIPTQWEALP